MREYYFTSEFVTPGHPDKIADQISDSILDACLMDDPESKVACETLVTTGQVIVAGEISTNTYVDIQKIVRDKIKEIGYKPGLGFDYDCGILNAIHSQSSDIFMGVKTGGAGDQGIIFGGAVDETEELMPLSITLARNIIFTLNDEKVSKKINWKRPDGKTQVTLIYDENHKIVGIDSIVLSVQHDENITLSQIEEDLIKYVLRPALNKYGFNIDDVKNIYINPTGRFVIGGPHGDTGLTGRKLIVDTYGGYFRHGGGAFSGKDPSKVDRSAAYAARWVAKNIVASKIAKKCEIQLSYAIGIDKPLSILVETFNTSKYSKEELSKMVYDLFDLTPNGIINQFKLKNPDFRYQDLAKYGHIGRSDIKLPWEKLNMVEKIKKYFNEE